MKNKRIRSKHAISSPLIKFSHSEWEKKKVRDICIGVRYVSN